MGTNDFLKVLPEMVTFVRVAELASFSAAAQQLGMTPSAVSRQVSRLEKQLQVQLIQRTTRNLRLTEVGVEVFARCCDLVTAAQDTMQVAQQYMHTPRGRVRIAAPKAFARRVLHPLLIEFLRRYQEVDVQVIVTDRDVDAIKEGVDLVIRLTNDPPEGLAARKLVAVESILCATPRYLAHTGEIEHPRDLVARSCLCLGEHTWDHRWRFRRGDELVEVVVEGRYTANHSEMRLEGVLADLGVSCLPDFIARSSIESGEIVRVLPEWELQTNYQGVACVLFPPNRFTIPKTRVLIDFLVEHLDLARSKLPS